MFGRGKLKLHSIFGIFFFVFVILSYLVFQTIRKDTNPPAFTQSGEEFISEGFYFPDDITMQMIASQYNLSCRYNEDGRAESCSLIPPLPYMYLKEAGYDGVLTWMEKAYPYRTTLCADIEYPKSDIRWTIECAMRNGITVDPISPPPEWVRPPGKDGAEEFFSIIDGKRFRPEGKIGYNLMPHARSRRALGLRITPAAIESLETALENYLNSFLPQLVNCTCGLRFGDNTCTECCVRSTTSCCVSDPLTGSCLVYHCQTWCGAGQCPPSSGGGGGGLNCAGISCPGATCAPSTYNCSAIPLFADCAGKDSMLCQDNGSTGSSCNVVGGTGCVGLGALNIEGYDCFDYNPGPFPFTFPRCYLGLGFGDNNCNNDSLSIDIFISSLALETFSRVANYVSRLLCGSINCNNSNTEIRCSSDCGTSQTCACRCCDDSQAGCGLINWPPGCPCCDDRIRVGISFGSGIVINGMAFLIYGPNAAPGFFTACNASAGSWKPQYPGEWINLCACVRNASFPNYNFQVCDFGFLNICGTLMEWFTGADDVRCQIVNQLNGVLGNALSSLMGTGGGGISAMVSLGACNTNSYNLGIYPEFCAGGSLAYSHNFSTGGAGLNIFLDTAVQITQQNSCVIGNCLQYPTQVPASVCGDTSAASNVHNCLPNVNSYDIGLYVQQETINELLYLAWTQGYLCSLSFNIPPEVSKILIPGLRQIFPGSTTVNMQFRPVCTNPTPTFQTGGGSTFSINIPEFRMRFTALPTGSPAQALFDLQASANISGSLQRVIGGCHPLDTLCATNPTFRCRTCTGVGACSTSNIPYGGGWLQVANFSLDTNVFGVISLNPAFNMTPPYTEIGDLIGNLLGGLLDQAALLTRIYNLFVVPLRISSLVHFGFANNALIATLDLPDPFCLNFILEFGNFAPDAAILAAMVEDNYWPDSVSPLKYMLESGEIGEDEYNRIIEEIKRTEEENKIRTTISVYEVDGGGRRLGTYAEDVKFVDIKIPFSSKGVKVKVKSELIGFYPDGSSEVKFGWRRKNGYFWYNIEGDEFYFKPLTRQEEIEIFAYVQRKYEADELPEALILEYDKIPAVLRVRKGMLDVTVVGPDRVRGGRVYDFEVKPEVEALYYSIDGGNSWSERIEGSRFSVSFPEQSTVVEIQVQVEKGEEMGFSIKSVKVEPTRGCGSLFGIIPFLGILVYSISLRKKGV